MNLSNGDGIEAYFCNKYIYYTRVQNFFFVDQKPFLNWVHVHVRYAKSFLHPPLSEVIVVLLFLHRLYEVKHFTLVKEGSGSLYLQWYFFVLKWKFYFILQPETDPNHKWASRWDYILDSMPHTKIQWFR